MCEPISIAMGIASTAASVSAQKNAAKMQKMQQERASKAEQRRIRQQYSSMRVQEAAEQKAAAVELQQAQIASFEAYGEAASVDSGVGGNSIQQIQNSYLQALGQTRSSIYEQLALNKVQREYAFESAGMQSQSNQIGINKPIAPVDYLGSAVSGISTGLSTYSALDSAGIINQGVANTGTSMQNVAKLSQKSSNMGMLDLPKYKQPFNAYT